MLDVACGGPASLAQFLLRIGAGGSAEPSDASLLLWDRVVMEGCEHLLLFIIVVLLIESSGTVETPRPGLLTEWFEVLGNADMWQLDSVSKLVDRAIALYGATPLSLCISLSSGTTAVE